MMLIDIGKGQWVDPEQIAAVTWSANQSRPAVHLKGSNGLIFADFWAATSVSTPEEKEALVDDLVKHIATKWRESIAIEVGLPPLVPSGHEPPAPTERAVRDVSPIDAPMVTHDDRWHLDDPVRRSRCPICNPGGTMGTGPATTS